MKYRRVISSHLKYLLPSWNMPQHSLLYRQSSLVTTPPNASLFTHSNSAWQCSADVGLSVSFLNPQDYTAPFLAFCHSPAFITTTLHETFYKDFFQAPRFSFLPFTAKLLERASLSPCGSPTTCNSASSSIILLN